MSNEIAVVKDQLPAAQQSGAVAMLTAITQAASNPAVDIDKMERLWAMHQKMVEREAEMAFNAAFSRAQAKMPIVAAQSRNDQTNSRYAKLAVIVDAIAPIYTDEGFSVSFNNAESPKEGNIRVLAKLSHPCGHSRDYQIDMPLDNVGMKGTQNKTNVHATGATNSYARRYLTLMIWNLTTEDDIDAQKRPAKVTPNAGAGDDLSEEQRQSIVNTIVKVREWLEQDSIGDAYLEAENAGWDVEEKRYAWSLLTSDQRSTLKAEGVRIRKEAAKKEEKPVDTGRPIISEGQRKRLEARIGELKLGREVVKAYIKTKWGHDHFADLDNEEYKLLDELLPNLATTETTQGGKL